jgi:hypothetical protein
MRITAENMTSIAIGTKVVMVWGAYYPTEEGLVVDYKIMPPSKFFPAKYMVVVEGDNGRIHDTTEFVSSGVGIYLESVYMQPRSY